MLTKSAKSALENCTWRKRVLRASPSVQVFKIGHWAQACKSSKLEKVFEVAEEESSFFLEEIVDVCEVQSNPTKSPWIATVLVDKMPVNFKLDSGADVTVIPYNTFLNIDLKIQLKPSTKVLLGPCNCRMNCKGEFIVTLAYNQTSIKEPHML